MCFAVATKDGLDGCVIPAFLKLAVVGIFYFFPLKL